MVTRRTFVDGALVLPALAGLLGAADNPDAGKILQSAVHYQTKANGTKMCSSCVSFLPGATADADGSCKIVAGVISPHGYCGAYSPK